MTEVETELNRLEELIRQRDEPGIQARWESGRALLALRNGKSLPKGVRQFMSETLGVSGSEVNARIRLAEECKDEAEVSAIVRKWGSWHAITHKALIKSPRPRTEKSPIVQNEGHEVGDVEGVEGDEPTPTIAYRLYDALDILRELEPADMDDNDVVLLREVIKIAERWINAVDRLRSIKAA